LALVSPVNSFTLSDKERLRKSLALVE